MDRQAPVASILSLFERVPLQLEANARVFLFAGGWFVGTARSAVALKFVGTPCTFDIQLQREESGRAFKAHASSVLGQNPPGVLNPVSPQFLSISTRNLSWRICFASHLQGCDVRCLQKLRFIEEDATTELVAETMLWKRSEAAMDSAAAPVVRKSPRPLLALVVEETREVLSFTCDGEEVSSKAPRSWRSC